jgi:segregation and condensation protein A
MREGDIESMVLKPTWKEILLEMIASERLDPWNMDISIIANGFLKKVKEMESVELHLPANVILAAAILLKYKSAVLDFSVPVAAEQADELDYPMEEIPALELVARIPPKAPVTIHELMEEIDKAMKFEEPKAPKLPPKPLELVLPEPNFDIEAKMEDVVVRVKKNTDASGWATFSGLMDTWEGENIIRTLLSLLHLQQKDTLDLRQDEFFGEIFIKMH